MKHFDNHLKTYFKSTLTPIKTQFDAFLKLAFFALILPFFTACGEHAINNAYYENALIAGVCDESFFAEQKKKVDADDDVIYTGINTASLARNCQKFTDSNYLFDKVEDAYKFDVDLQGLGSKGGKFIGSMLLNDGAFDYEGKLYERIMVNVYKGLNFMALGDFANARVEFNRALARQDKAKEYFAREIEANRANFDAAKEDANYKQNMNANASAIMQKYDHLLEDFATTQDYTNPYATYLAAVFFFMDKDYKKAGDLFREVAIVNKNSAEFNKELTIFNKFVTSFNTEKLPKYIFVVYESGFGVGLDEFSLTLPFISNGKIITSSIALPLLKKRGDSHEYLLANGVRTGDFVSFDTIIASEFKANLGVTIGKALSSTIAKTVINAAVANNDPTGGYLALAVSFFNSANTKADVRVWNALPKSAKVLMLENKGVLSVLTPSGTLLYKNEKLNKNKHFLILIKSVSVGAKSVVWTVER